MKQWAAEILLALEALHEQGVLCRDLNPQNLLLDQAGRSPSLPAPTTQVAAQGQQDPQDYKATSCSSPFTFLHLSLYRGHEPGAEASGTPLGPGQQGAMPLGRLHLG